jgi:hypothetical protein
MESANRKVQAKNSETKRSRWKTRQRQGRGNMRHMQALDTSEIRENLPEM